MTAASTTDSGGATPGGEQRQAVATDGGAGAATPAPRSRTIASSQERLTLISPLDRRGQHHEVVLDDGREYQTVVEGRKRYYRLIERRPDGLWAGLWRTPDGTPAP